MQPSGKRSRPVTEILLSVIPQKPGKESKWVMFSASSTIIEEAVELLRQWQTVTVSSQLQHFPYVLSHPPLHKQIINKILAPVTISHACNCFSACSNASKCKSAPKHWKCWKWTYQLPRLRRQWAGYTEQWQAAVTFMKKKKKMGLWAILKEEYEWTSSSRPERIHVL